MKIRWIIVIKKQIQQIKSVKSYKERLFTDYERTRKNRSKKPNYLTEVVAVK